MDREPEKFELTGPKREELVKAISDAYRGINRIERLARRWTSIGHDEITPGAPVFIIEGIINKAESRGELKQLIEGACRGNPGNAKLREFYRKYMSPDGEYPPPGPDDEKEPLLKEDESEEQELPEEEQGSGLPDPPQRVPPAPPQDPPPGDPPGPLSDPPPDSSPWETDTRRSAWYALLVVLVVALATVAWVLIQRSCMFCSPPPPVILDDGGVDAGPPPPEEDAGVDGGMDGGAEDAGTPDAGTPDAGVNEGTRKPVRVVPPKVEEGVGYATRRVMLTCESIACQFSVRSTPLLQAGQRQGREPMWSEDIRDESSPYPITLEQGRRYEVRAFAEEEGRRLQGIVTIDATSLRESMSRVVCTYEETALDCKWPR